MIRKPDLSPGSTRQQTAADTRPTTGMAEQTTENRQRTNHENH